MFKNVCAALLFGLGANAAAVAAGGPQDELEITLNSGETLLEFDWPILEIGTAEYEAGPTGATVFRFGRKVHVAIDVRGGGPGTVNAPYMELGYKYAELDTVVFAGGSWYGLEAVTGVATALIDDGVRDAVAWGEVPNLAMSVGSVIYDLGPRRFNEIYPDKRLGQAAYRAARPGVFALGAHGGGRLAVSGGFFDCNAKSGQGGAFRQIGDVKIAVFTVVNALGVIVDRDGRVVACYGGEDWPEDLYAKDLLTSYPATKDGDWQGPERKNTTLTLVVVNQKMTPVDLKRLAVQAHTSMARAIQPYSTVFDGDVLYAVSTGEVEKTAFEPIELGVIAGEVAWDAILSSVPEQPRAPAIDLSFEPAPETLQSHAGDYIFSDEVSLRVAYRRGKLVARASGSRDVFSIDKKSWTQLHPLPDGRYVVPERYPFVIVFEDDRMKINPGRWAQTGRRLETAAP
ncbi:MAG: P1 family peptidase [Pseudomonadota bacterium]